MDQLSFLHLAAIVLAWIGACTGHAVILVASLNWWYSVPLRRSVLSLLKKLHALAILAGPVVFWAVFGFRLETLFAPPPGDSWQWALSGYFCLCVALGLAAFPSITLWRLLRRRPAALLSNHTQTVDVAERLGFRPIGRGRRRQLAYLPGNEIFRVDLSERTICLPRLPAAWDGLSILHLSDLHLCGTPDRVFYQHVMDLCRDWQADLVAITGDIVDSDKHHRWIVPVLGRLRWKQAAFAVLGNHDSWHEPALVRRRLRRLGIRVLGNTWEEIELRGERLIVIGHEGPWFRPGPDLSNCPQRAFRLCLSHTPDNIRWARQNGIDLMLAGHNHGGQIRFPVIGSVFVPSRYSRRYDCGTFYEPPTVLHVSRGLGGQEPVRYNCRPEVTKIVLKRATTLYEAPQ